MSDASWVFPQTLIFGTSILCFGFLGFGRRDSKVNSKVPFKCRVIRGEYPSLVVDWRSLMLCCCPRKLQMVVEKQRVQRALWRDIFAQLRQGTLESSLRLQDQRLLRVSEGRFALSGIPRKRHRMVVSARNSSTLTSQTIVRTQAQSRTLTQF